VRQAHVEDEGRGADEPREAKSHARHRVNRHGRRRRRGAGGRASVGRLLERACIGGLDGLPELGVPGGVPRLCHGRRRRDRLLRIQPGHEEPRERAALARVEQEQDRLRGEADVGHEVGLAEMLRLEDELDGHVAPGPQAYNDQHEAGAARAPAGTTAAPSHRTHSPCAQEQPSDEERRGEERVRGGRAELRVVLLLRVRAVLLRRVVGGHCLAQGWQG
jgi:hypothetical protein